MASRDLQAERVVRSIFDDLKYGFDELESLGAGLVEPAGIFQSCNERLATGDESIRALESYSKSCSLDSKAPTVCMQLRASMPQYMKDVQDGAKKLANIRRLIEKDHVLLTRLKNSTGVQAAKIISKLAHALDFSSSEEFETHLVLIEGGIVHEVVGDGSTMVQVHIGVGEEQDDVQGQSARRVYAREVLFASHLPADLGHLLHALEEACCPLGLTANKARFIGVLPISPSKGTRSAIIVYSDAIAAECALAAARGCGLALRRAEVDKMNSDITLALKRFGMELATVNCNSPFKTWLQDTIKIGAEARSLVSTSRALHSSSLADLGRLAQRVEEAVKYFVENIARESTTIAQELNTIIPDVIFDELVSLRQATKQANSTLCDNSLGLQLNASADRQVA